MKKIIVQTVYHNCDDEFIKDYIDRLCGHNEFLKESEDDFLNGEIVGFRSDDPTSKAYAITEYKLEPYNMEKK